MIALRFCILTSFARVSKSEILTYFADVLRKHQAGGRLAYYPQCEYQGERRFVSADGVTYQVEVAVRVVDTTYSDITVPLTRAPAYGVDASLTLVPINALVEHRGEKRSEGLAQRDARTIAFVLPCSQ